MKPRLDVTAPFERMAPDQRLAQLRGDVEKGRVQAAAEAIREVEIGSLTQPAIQVGALPFGSASQQPAGSSRRMGGELAARNLRSAPIPERVEPYPQAARNATARCVDGWIDENLESYRSTWQALTELAGKEFSSAFALAARCASNADAPLNQKEATKEEAFNATLNRFLALDRPFVAEAARALAPVIAQVREAMDHSDLAKKLAAAGLGEEQVAPLRLHLAGDPAELLRWDLNRGEVVTSLLRRALEDRCKVGEFYRLRST
jgi:hypothetical protein